jgi:hypothetical protein
MRVSKSRSPGFASLADVQLVEEATSTDVLDLRSSIAALPIALRVPLILATYCGLSSKEMARSSTYAQAPFASASGARRRFWANSFHLGSTSNRTGALPYEFFRQRVRSQHRSVDRNDSSDRFFGRRR